MFAARNMLFAGAFNPLSLSPALWLDASDASTLFTTAEGSTLSGANGSVGRWEDKSGNAWHATAASNLPIRKVEEENGRDVVQFNGTNNLLGVTASGALNIFRAREQGYIFMVCRDTNPRALSSQHVGMIFTNDSVSAARAWVSTRSPGNAYQIAGRRLDSDSAVLSLTETDTNSADIVLLENRSNWSSGTMQIFVNGAGASEANYSSGAGNTSNTPSVIRIGGTNVADRFFPGNICEVIVINSALTSGQISQLRQHLAAKWNITLA